MVDAAVVVVTHRMVAAAVALHASLVPAAQWPLAILQQTCIRLALLRRHSSALLK
jgi:hypothetical protein